MNHAEHKRSTFSGKIGFVLSAAGASVGLGNIWRFPYLAAKYGGGIFLLVYIILAMTFGYTMIVAETSHRPHDRQEPGRRVRCLRQAPAGCTSAAGSTRLSPSSSCRITRSSAAGSSNTWPSTSSATAASWRRTAISARFISNGASTELCFVHFRGADAGDHLRGRGKRHRARIQVHDAGAGRAVDHHRRLFRDAARARWRASNTSSCRTSRISRG